MVISLLVGNITAQETSKSKKKTRKSPPASEATQNKSVEGVVQVGPLLSPQEASGKIIKGKTTLEGIQLLLGPPSHITMMGDTGGRMVMYNWRKELATPSLKITGNQIAGALPGPLSAFSWIGASKRVQTAKNQMEEVRSSYRSLTMMFNGEGVLKDFQFSPPLPVEPVQPTSPLVTINEPK